MYRMSDASRNSNRGVGLPYLSALSRGCQGFGGVVPIPEHVIVECQQGLEA